MIQVPGQTRGKTAETYFKKTNTGLRSRSGESRKNEMTAQFTPASNPWPLYLPLPGDTTPQYLLWLGRYHPPILMLWLGGSYSTIFLSRSASVANTAALLAETWPGLDPGGMILAQHAGSVHHVCVAIGMPFGGFVDVLKTPRSPLSIVHRSYYHGTHGREFSQIVCAICIPWLRYLPGAPSMSRPLPHGADYTLATDGLSISMRKVAKARHAKM